MEFQSQLVLEGESQSCRKLAEGAHLDATFLSRSNSAITYNKFEWRKITSQTPKELIFQFCPWSQFSKFIHSSLVNVLLSVPCVAQTGLYFWVQAGQAVESSSTESSRSSGVEITTLTISICFSFDYLVFQNSKILYKSLSFKISVQNVPEPRLESHYLVVRSIFRALFDEIRSFFGSKQRSSRQFLWFLLLHMHRGTGRILSCTFRRLWHNKAPPCRLDSEKWSNA